MSTTPIDPLLARPLQAGGDAAAGHSHVSDADPTTAEVAPTSVADDVDIDVVVVVESFEVAYQRLYPQLVRLAYLLVDTVEHAEEAVQEAFAKAYPRWGRIERPDTYMRTAVVNTCRRVQRRRVRARRARHVAAVSLPAVAGLALVGLRQTPMPNPLSSATAPEPSDPGLTGPASPTSTTTVESTIPASPTSTTTVESTTAPPELFDGVVCLDATPDASVERCLASLPGARPMTAPSYMIIKDTPMFVVPADPAYQAEAQALSDRLGLPFRPDITAHLHQDLVGTDLTGVRVFVVLGTTDVTTCTIPWCDTAITPDAPLTDAP